MPKSSVPQNVAAANRKDDARLPCELDAERNLLGSVLAGLVSFQTLLGGGMEPDYFHARHFNYFAAMREIHQRGDIINGTTLYSELKKRGQVDKADLGYFADVSSDKWVLPNDAAAGPIMRIVKDAAVRSKGMIAAQSVIAALQISTEDPIMALMVGADNFADLRSRFHDERRNPKKLSCEDMLAIQRRTDEMLYDGVPIPAVGLTLLVGETKAGKTLLAAQIGVSVACNRPLLEYYRLLAPGPVLVVEKDDPDGSASFGDILRANDVTDVPFDLVDDIEFGFGNELLEYIERQVLEFGYRLVVLDSYTALRSSRAKGSDLVKIENEDFRTLNKLAKRLGIAIIVIHHGSKASANLHWTQSAAGSFAIGAAIDGQVHISRFAELGGAKERLIRVRQRHGDDYLGLLRFRKATLNYEWVMDGEASEHFPLLIDIQTHIGSGAFTPKQLIEAAGVSRATVHRRIGSLVHAGALEKRGYGEYAISRSLRF